MKHMTCCAVLITLLLSWGTAHAADIQYMLSNNNVRAVSDTPIIPVNGRGIVSLAGNTAAQIVWPIPNGCPAGQPTWTRISNPSSVTAAGAGMVVRPGLVIFKTTSTLLPGCYEVRSAIDVDTLCMQAVLNAFPGLRMQYIQMMNDINVAVLRRCPGATGGADCDTSRNNMVTLNSEYPTAAAIASFTTQVVILQTDATTLKNQQGW